NGSPVTGWSYRTRLNCTLRGVNAHPRSTSKCRLKIHCATFGSFVNYHHIRCLQQRFQMEHPTTTTMSRCYNFSAGPAVLPLEVLQKAQDELVDWQGSGMSVMEMSHRGKEYTSIHENAIRNLRTLMNIPDNYKVLFLQGGASTQFAMVPLNLFSQARKADYINTGAWSKKAIAEAKRYGTVKVIASSEDKNFSYIPEFDPSMISPDADYVH